MALWGSAQVLMVLTSSSWERRRRENILHNPRKAPHVSKCVDTPQEAPSGVTEPPQSRSPAARRRAATARTGPHPLTHCQPQPSPPPATLSDPVPWPPPHPPTHIPHSLPPPRPDIERTRARQQRRQRLRALLRVRLGGCAPGRCRWRVRRNRRAAPGAARAEHSRAALAPLPPPPPPPPPPPSPHAAPSSSVPV